MHIQSNTLFIKQGIVFVYAFGSITNNKKNLSQVLDKILKAGIIERVEKAQGPLVKGLRHRLFTAVTRVRIPYGL